MLVRNIKIHNTRQHTSILYLHFIPSYSLSSFTTVPLLHSLHSTHPSSLYFPYCSPPLLSSSPLPLPFSPHLTSSSPLLSPLLSSSPHLISSLPLPFSPPLLSSSSHLTSSPLTGGFIIRIFSTAPVVVELVANLYHVSKMGDWKKTSEVDRHYITHSFFFCLFHLLGCLYVP